MYPESLQALIDSFRRLPGVGLRTAERYALNVTDLPQEEIEAFASALMRVKRQSL